MNVYKVEYELIYPESNEDIRIAYVLAEDFNIAVRKVERSENGEYEMASVKSVKLQENHKIII